MISSNTDYNPEIMKELTDHIIPFWTGLSDDTYGGWYGYLSYDLVLDKEAEKGCILNSRITWFFANAYMLLGYESRLNQAKRGYSFMMKHMIDRDYGGVYWSVDRKGIPVDTTKHVYNQAFAIYALSSYYDATGDMSALGEALTLFHLIEDKCRDADGYLESFSRTFEVTGNDKLSENGVNAKRTMNTLLHVIEGYTELYRVSGYTEVGDRLADALMILAERIYDAKRNRMDVFFDMEYRSLIDLYSYGHDIETGWLADRALDVLECNGPKVMSAAGTDKCNSKRYEKTVAELRPILVNLRRNVFKVAFDGNSLPLECEAGKVDTRRVWWVQAETVVGMVNGYRRDGCREYLEAAKSEWNYIKNYIIDKRPGSEWYWVINEDATPVEGEPIVEPWKCPYHNGRMCIEVLKGDTRVG